MFDLLMNAALNGLLLGGVLALLAFGMNLIFGVIKIIHMAYGQCVMLGMYFIYTWVTHLGMPVLLACVLTLPIMGVVGMGLQMFVINPLLRAKANPLTQLLALAGLTIVIENLAQVIWGADLRGINIQLPLISFGNVFLRTSNLIAFFGALLTLWGLYLFLNRTYLGLAIRSIAQDVDSSRLMGINPQAIYYVTMAAGGVLTGVIAAFFSPIYAVHPHFGGSFTMMAFIIVVLGGMGNLLGGFIGAFVIGLVTSLSAALTSTEIADIIALVIFIAVILIRPQGLLGIRVSK
ncbi:MAG: branched-chain amino acid ABC transporter permease [Deltaproteobacteria bacterium]|nr:MAG: branched-chain amino acid ABC transporter permease [Deltaproteobacteria bacterium]RPJ42792.1 MAG: branched-chain amino acid ABC transporter permease [Deltaproteobacteria bacterium]